MFKNASAAKAPPQTPLGNLQHFPTRSWIRGRGGEGKRRAGDDGRGEGGRRDGMRGELRERRVGKDVGRGTEGEGKGREGKRRKGEEYREGRRGRVCPPPFQLLDPPVIDLLV